MDWFRDVHWFWNILSVFLEHLRRLKGSRQNVDVPYLSELINALKLLKFPELGNFKTSNFFFPIIYNGQYFIQNFYIYSIDSIDLRVFGRILEFFIVSFHSISNTYRKALVRIRCHRKSLYFFLQQFMVIGQIILIHLISSSINIQHILTCIQFMVFLKKIINF